MSKNNAKLYDLQMLISAGIDPKTGLPIALRNGGISCIKKEDIKKQLRIADEQDAINRYTWYNLPKGLNSRLIERILYYRGQGMFFKLDDKFYFLPYALDGTIDVYGRFTGVTPLPFNGTANDGKPDKLWIQGLTFKPQYEVMLPEEHFDDSPEQLQNILERSCVIVKDYTEQMSQTNIARQILNDPLLDFMSECMPFMRTALLNSTGVKGMRVYTEGESSNVYAANDAITRAALEGRPNIPIIGDTDFQELTSKTDIANAEQFLLAMQSLDNYRLGLYGIENGGIFQKQQHILQIEQQMNAGNVGLKLRDGLQYRQEAASIANSIWGTQIWCEVSETVLGVDTTGDGVLGDNEAGQKEMMMEEATVE